MALQKQESTVAVAPSMVKFWDTALGKTLRAGIYLSVSGLVAFFIAEMQNNPVLFGVYTPIVNVILVALKGLFDPKVKNF